MSLIIAGSIFLFFSPTNILTVNNCSQLSCNDRQQQIVILIASNENFMTSPVQASQPKAEMPKSDSTMAHNELFPPSFSSFPYLDGYYFAKLFCTNGEYISVVFGNCEIIGVSSCLSVSALAGQRQKGVWANQRNLSRHPLPRSQVLRGGPLQAGRGDNQISVLPPSEKGYFPRSSACCRGPGCRTCSQIVRAHV